MNNVERLVIERAAQLIADRGKAETGDAFTGVLTRLMDKRASDDMREAKQWVMAAIAVIQSAPGGSAYGDDERIAGEILRQIQMRKDAKAAVS